MSRLESRHLMAAAALDALGTLADTLGHVSTKALGVGHDDLATDDYRDELEAAMEHAVANGKILMLSSGVARVSRPVRVPNGLRMVAEDATSGIRNGLTEDASNLRSPLLLGNWHPAYLGYWDAFAPDATYADPAALRLAAWTGLTNGVSDAAVTSLSKVFLWDATSDAVGNDTTVIKPDGIPGDGRWLVTPRLWNLAELRLIASGGLANGDERIVAGRGTYKWDANSAEADDGVVTVKPNNVDETASGRWLALWAGVVVTLCRTTGPVAADDRSIVLANTLDADRFEVGAVYPILTKEMDIQASTGIQLRIPHNQSCMRVTGKDGAVITFEHSIGFGTATPVWLVGILPTAQDQFQLPIYILSDVEIEGINVYGVTAYGTNCTSVYNTKLTNWGGKVDHVGTVNSLAHSVIDGFTGEFTGDRCLEVKFGSHDFVVRGIRVVNKDGRKLGTYANAAALRAVASAAFVDWQWVAVTGGANLRWDSGSETLENGITVIKPTDIGASSPGRWVLGGGAALFSIGEYCRNGIVEDFDVDAPLWNNGHAFQMQPGTNVILRNGRVNVPAGVLANAYFYSDDGRAMVGCGIEKVDHIHGCAYHVIFDSVGTHQPTLCFYRNNRLIKASAGAITAAVVFNGGKLNEVTGNEWSGKTSFPGAPAQGNFVHDNIGDTATVDGAFVAQNHVGAIYVRSGGNRTSKHDIGERVTGTRTYTSGSGLEVSYDNATGALLTSIDRDTGTPATRKLLTVDASAHDFIADNELLIRFQKRLIWPRITDVTDLGYYNGSLDKAQFKRLYLSDGIYVGNAKVVGARGAAIADATDAASAITQLNALLAAARTHGLIAP